MAQTIVQIKEGHTTREQVYRDIKDTLGIVPSFFKTVPDSSLELEWKLMKRVQMDKGAIPNKYRELIGVAVSSVMRCKYCSFFHAEMAKLNGATDAEIEDAVHFAKSSAGWSTYINGMQTDFEHFKNEIMQIVEHARSTGNK